MKVIWKASQPLPVYPKNSMTLQIQEWQWLDQLLTTHFANQEINLSYDEQPKSKL